MKKKINNKKVYEVVEAFVILMGVAATLFSAIPEWIKSEDLKLTLQIVIGVLTICLLINKIILISSTTWTKCDKFPNPNGNHVCNMVEYCLSKHTKGKAGYEKNTKSSDLVSDGHTDVIKVLFDEVKECLQHSKKNLRMTLPLDPYSVHILTRFAAFEDTATVINSAHLKKRTKIISLQDSELEKFSFNFFQDIKTNINKLKVGNRFFSKKSSITEFDKYLNVHRKKNIELNWHKNEKDTPTDEYIIFDDNVCISCNSTAVIFNFSSAIVDTKISDFDQIGNTINTPQFIDRYITPQISTHFPDPNEQKIVEKYLKSIKK
jgi:hypothetical protein